MKWSQFGHKFLEVHPTKAYLSKMSIFLLSIHGLFAGISMITDGKDDA